jgi:hypothetical protein
MVPIFHNPTSLLNNRIWDKGLVKISVEIIRCSGLIIGDINNKS